MKGSMIIVLPFYLMAQGIIRVNTRVAINA